MLTCCDNPVHVLNNVEHRYDSDRRYDMTCVVTWACASCGARTTIENMRIDDRRAQLLQEALADANAHSFNSVVKQRYRYDNEVDIEDGGVLTPGVRVR